MKTTQEKMTLQDAYANNDNFLAFLEQDARSGDASKKKHARPTSHPSGEKLHEYVFGWLDEAETRQIQDHIAACELCAVEVLNITQDEEELEQSAADWADDVPIIERVIAWVSEFWKPSMVGQVVTAADIPEQKHEFHIQEGTINITCNWQSAYREHPAYVRIEWEANLNFQRELWVKFCHPETHALLAEFPLGTDLEGEKHFTTQDLGFDPSRELWEITIGLREVEV